MLNDTYIASNCSYEARRHERRSFPRLLQEDWRLVDVRDGSRVGDGKKGATVGRNGTENGRLRTERTRNEAWSRRRWSGEPTSRCSHWSNLRDRGTYDSPFLSPFSLCTRGDLALWRVRIERNVCLSFSSHRHSSTAAYREFGTCTGCRVCFFEGIFPIAKIRISVICNRYDQENLKSPGKCNKSHCRTAVHGCHMRPISVRTRWVYQATSLKNPQDQTSLVQSSINPQVW